MENKKTFSQFIAMKRREKNITQEELAQRLYLSPTAISKWERGISYPDITLISDICRELDITEHEFITACDDPRAKAERDQARKYRIISRIFQWSFPISYGIALLSCFICNLAISHTLSWFFIVLLSIGLSFCVTSLPFLLKKYFPSLSKKTSFLIIAGVVTILIYLLLAVCCFYQRGDWFFSEAVPVATYIFSILWLSIGICMGLRLNWFYKSAILSLLFGIAAAATNPIMSYLLSEPMEGGAMSLGQFFSLTYWGTDQAVNKIIAFVCFAYFLIGMAAGLFYSKKR